MTYLFELGRTIDLCKQEFSQVVSARFPSASYTYLAENIAFVDGIEEDAVYHLQDTLGSVVKVARVVIDEETKLPENDVYTRILKLLLDQSQSFSKVTFAVGGVAGSNISFLSKSALKRDLLEKGIASRYISSNQHGLSASVLLHQGVTELLLFRRPERTIIAQTIAIQDIDSWTIRDRKKPFADRKHGMLPPKVARMMINLALPSGAAGKRVLDPFCGTGTVLLEAVTLEAEAIGADIREEAARQSKENLSWYTKKYLHDKDVKFMTLAQDATHLTQTAMGGMVDAIVAEGYLGPLTPAKGRLENIFKGLEKLYKGSFKQWTEILKPGARVCIALPRVEGKRMYSLFPLVDGLKEFGYTTVSEPVVYDRPGAITQREIFVLEFQRKV